MDIFCSIKCTFSNSNKAQCMSAVSSVCISTSLFFLVLQRTFCRCTIFKAANPYAAILHSLLRLYKKNKGINMKYTYLLWCRKLFVFQSCIHMQKGHYKKHSFSLSHTQINTTKEWQPELAILLP